jgi:restriction endonuclease S subunit
VTSDRVLVGDVLSLQRRTVDVDPGQVYREIGIRSFGRGIFHKEPISGADLGSKRVFYIQPGDLVISNVFAWEGAIALASSAEAGMIGSHRFMTFVPKDGLISTSWASWFFKSDLGLTLIRQASPGSAGRNRTLAVGRFEALKIPLPVLDEQVRIADRLNRLEATAARLRHMTDQASALISALVPSALNRAFAGYE